MDAPALVTGRAPADTVGAADAAAAAPPLVRVRDFGKRYGGAWALRGAALDVARGELFGLVGPDGAGKSSLLKAIAGVLAHDAGTVELFGTRVDSERSAERVKDRLGFMPQGLGLNLYHELSVEENVDFFARLRLVPEGALRERKRRLLALTRLEPFRSRPVKHLSGGMKQKLGLVCTLVHEPQLLVLDEPTTGVDPVSRRDFWSILTELVRERRITALVSTAYMDEAARFDRLALLHQGRVVARGTPEEVLALAPGSVIVARAEPQLEAFARLSAAGAAVDAFGPWLRVFTREPDRDRATRDVRATLAGARVIALHTAPPELEDVFLALVRAEPAPRARLPVMVPRASAAHGGETLVEAAGLVRDFGAFRAVDHVGFRIASGEIFGLLGANGAGKTTVIKMLTGLLAPTAGSARIEGVDMRRAGRALRERIGYVSQAFSLYRDLTVAENLRLYAGIYGLGRRAAEERTAWVLRMAELAGQESVLAGRLPLGLRQRLALGCALVHRPRVLFLDEPTSGVDPVGRRRIWETIFRLSREEGVAVLVTTHYMSEAERCDRLGLMFGGRLVADAAPEEMKAGLPGEDGRPPSMEEVFVARVTALERANGSARQEGEP